MPDPSAMLLVPLHLLRVRQRWLQQVHQHLREMACCIAAIRSILPSSRSCAHSTGSSGLLAKRLMEGYASRSLLRDIRASTSARPRNGKALSFPSVSAA